MEFDEILTRVIELLQRQGRISYGALKRRFHLDDEYLQDLKDELIDAQRVAVDEGGKVLAWTGNSSLVSSVQSLESEGQGRTLTVQTLDSRRQTLDVAERRQLTVMFCDLVGSTALSTQLDPEELRGVVQAYQETCSAVIRRYEGHIAQHLGDGLLVYFGYPAAHEDNAQRAVRTGLEIVQALQSRARQQAASAPLPHGRGSDPLSVRIGIHTGLVVIGEIGSSEKREILALGETPNLAARIQGQANPDEVVISAATYHLVEGLFECEGRGEPEIKGVATPLTLYRVLQESETHSRFQVVARKGLTPLVGREHEFGLLCERWERVKDGVGQVVLLSGEPGIGKSRLVEALKEPVEQKGIRCLELRCSPYTQNSALAPVIEHLQRVLQFQPDETPAEKLQKVEQALSRSRLDLQQTVPLFASLLSLPATHYPLPAFSPQKQKEKTYEALVAWLGAEAKQHPVMYAWEDLHWADPSTLELLTLFLAQVPTTRLLAVLTFRPEFVPPWGAHSYLSQLTLSRLGRAHVETMVEKVTGGRVLSTDVIQQIVNKTDGVPLFVEELTKSVVESVEIRSHSPLRLGIPATLQDALMARLDRLGPAKEIAQLSATLGREFTYELLHAVSPLNEDSLHQGLRRLVETELLFQSSVPPQARYLFKHALVQDTAYQSLLKSRRQQLHQQIARVLEEKFLQTVETQPEVVAYHYTEAGLIAQAIPYWQQAGQRAAQRSASVEAVAHLTRALELLNTLPDTLERAQQELTLQIALGAPLMAAKGYAAPEVERAYARAQELCQQVGETPQLFRVLSGLWFFYLARAELQTAHEFAKQLLNLAQNVQDSAFLVEAQRALGMTLWHMGEFASAQKHCEQGIALYNAEAIREAVQKLNFYVFAPWMYCQGFVALSLWLLGYPDQALKKVQEGLALAQEMSRPYNVAFALNWAATLHQFRREAKLTQELAEAAIALSKEHKFPQWVAAGSLLRGKALAEQGQAEEGIAQMRRVIARIRAVGTKTQVPHFLALLAEAYGNVGQTEEGLAALVEALAVLDKTGERFYEAELYRLKGELLLAQESTEHGAGSKEQKLENADSRSLTLDPQGEAEACFLKAIEIARKQQAKSLELRATTSLARLWRQQDKHAEAHKLLENVYNWFTEGFDTKDLQEAKTLLGELNR